MTRSSIRRTACSSTQGGACSKRSAPPRPGGAPRPGWRCWSASTQARWASRPGSGRWAAGRGRCASRPRRSGRGSGSPAARLALPGSSAADRPPPAAPARIAPPRHRDALPRLLALVVVEVGGGLVPPGEETDGVRGDAPGEELPRWSVTNRCASGRRPGGHLVSIQEGPVAACAHPLWEANGGAATHAPAPPAARASYAACPPLAG